MIAHVCTVRYDNMVEEIHSHYGTCVLDCRCKRIICPAGCKASAGVIMAYGHDGGIIEDCLTHNDSDVGRGLSNTANADTLCFQKFVVLLTSAVLTFPRLCPT